MDQQNQSYSNHTKWDPPFHFFMAPISLINAGWCIWRAIQNATPVNLWIVAVALAFVVTVFKTRIYSLKVQDRLIRLEENLRLTRLSPSAAEACKLTEAQFIGLRFASDGELVALAQRAAKEGMTAKQIKQAISQWRADHFRV